MSRGTSHYHPLMVVHVGTVGPSNADAIAPETPEAQSIRLDRERIRKAFASIEFDHPCVKA